MVSKAADVQHRRAPRAGPRFAVYSPVTSRFGRVVFPVIRGGRVFKAVRNLKSAKPEARALVAADLFAVPVLDGEARTAASKAAGVGKLVRGGPDSSVTGDLVAPT